MRKELVIGCGRRIVKDLSLEGMEHFDEFVTLDNNKEHNPDIVHDLTEHPLPFIENEFDEIHAYDVLEHLAYQGDYEFFFKEFSEYWRILKHKGHMFISVPSETSKWALGDPSHKRVMTLDNFAFLNQQFYSQVGTTKASDFRSIYKADFRIIYHSKNENELLIILEAIKDENTCPSAELQNNGYSSGSVACSITG